MTTITGHSPIVYGPTSQALPSDIQLPAGRRPLDPTIAAPLQRALSLSANPLPSPGEIRLEPGLQFRLQDMSSSHRADARLVLAAGNREMARVHREITERIRIIRRLDFTKQARIDATYDEHAKILKAIQRKRGDQAAMLLRAHIETSQAEVRKITLHQVHLARVGGAGR